MRATLIEESWSALTVGRTASRPITTASSDVKVFSSLISLLRFESNQIASNIEAVEHVVHKQET